MEISSAEYQKYKETMMTIRSSWTITHPVKRPVIYLLVFIFAALLPALLFTMDVTSGISVYTKKIFYLASFLLIGIGHIFSFPKWLPHLYNHHRQPAWLYSIFLSAMAWLFNFLLFIVTGFENPQLALAGACSFLLPTAILQLWNHFDFVSTETYTPWFLPSAMPPQKMVAEYLNDLTVSIKLKINYYDIGERSFLLMVPGRLKLGNMFHKFLAEREEVNTKIQVADEHQKPYAWKFLRQRVLGTTMLDPELSLYENKLKQKDVILVDRIKVN